jgi:hypothetical protein
MDIVVSNLTLFIFKQILHARYIIYFTAALFGLNIDMSYASDDIYYSNKYICKSIQTIGFKPVKKEWRQTIFNETHKFTIEKLEKEDVVSSEGGLEVKDTYWKFEHESDALFNQVCKGRSINRVNTNIICDGYIQASIFPSSGRYTSSFLIGYSEGNDSREDVGPYLEIGTCEPSNK